MDFRRDHLDQPTGRSGGPDASHFALAIGGSVGWVHSFLRAYDSSILSIESMKARCPNTSPEPTPVGAGSSAFAGHVFWPGVAQLFR